MQVPTNQTSLITMIRLPGNPTDVAYNASGLQVSYRIEDDTSWTDLTLVAGTLGAYLSSSFVKEASGSDRYQLCWPNAAIESGKKTSVRITYGGASIYGRIDAVLGAGGGGGSGSGARTVTITVTDGTDPLQNAKVSLLEGATLYSATTNASGIAVFNVDDATYTVAISKSGYSFAGASLVVDGTEAVTYAMTQISITPSAGDLTTGVLTVLDTAGQPVGSVVISIEQRSAPDSSYGFAFDGTKRTVTSAVNGVAQIPGLVKGATYKVYRGDRQGYDCKIPIDAGATYELPSIVGVSA